MQLLVKNGANADSLNDENGNPIPELMQQFGQLNVQETLTSVLGANQRILEAARDNKWDVVEDELSKGAWVNVKDEETRKTPLMWAARYGEKDIVKRLVTE